jgi:hypothetical protein
MTAAKPLPAGVVETPYHAARLHALIIGLRCLDETSPVLTDDERTNVQDWLLYMASDESRLLMRSLGLIMAKTGSGFDQVRVPRSGCFQRSAPSRIWCARKSCT